MERPHRRPPRARTALYSPHPPLPTPTPEAHAHAPSPLEFTRMGATPPLFSSLLSPHLPGHFSHSGSKSLPVPCVSSIYIKTGSWWVVPAASTCSWRPRSASRPRGSPSSPGRSRRSPVSTPGANAFSLGGRRLRLPRSLWSLSYPSPPPFVPRPSSDDGCAGGGDFSTSSFRPALVAVARARPAGLSRKTRPRTVDAHLGSRRRSGVSHGDRRTEDRPTRRGFESRRAGAKKSGRKGGSNEPSSPRGAPEASKRRRTQTPAARAIRTKRAARDLQAAERGRRSTPGARGEADRWERATPADVG